MAWVERGNPIPQNPETRSVLAAFRALDFRVVVDQFLTDTAREADIVLPAKTMFEQSDLIGAYWHDYLQLKAKAIDPPGEVKPESEIYRLLGRRLGLEETADPKRFPVTDEEVDRYLERALEPFPGLSLERLREGPVLPPGHQEIAFEDLRFPTPSGRIELESEEAVRRWGVDRLPSFRESIREPLPFYLLTPNTKNRIHSQFNNLRMIRDVSPGPVVHLHPDDALEHGIAAGDRVRVSNERGELCLPAAFDHGIRRGCVAVTNGWWIRDGGAVNLLSAARETDMGHGAAFHDNRVRIERADRGT
jgi:anaerobic selenocysteine-containing dehydrogenase